MSDLKHGRSFLFFILALQLEIQERIDKEKLRADLQVILDKGIKSLAVVLMHAYT